MVRTCTDQTFTCAHHSVEGGQCMVQALGLGMSRNEGSVRCGRRHESPSSHDLEHLHHAAATVWHQQDPVCLSVCLFGTSNVRLLQRPQTLRMALRVLCALSKTSLAYVHALLRKMSAVQLTPEKTPGCDGHSYTGQPHSKQSKRFRRQV